MDATLKTTAKGQVTFSKSLLEHLGIWAGEELSVLRMPDGKLEIGSAAKELTFAEFRKIAQAKSRQIDNGVRASIDDIQGAISKAYVEHGARGQDE